MPVLQFWPPLLPQVLIDPLAMELSDPAEEVLLDVETAVVVGP